MDERVSGKAKDPIVVRGTEIVSDDPRQRYREKIARVTLDSMVQFVGLLDAHGTVLEINKVALDAVGIALSDVEGKPFWTTFWWQVSDEINATLRASIARAARGEFVRWDTPIYGRAGGRDTIIIDASLAPVVDDAGRVVFICAEGRDITEKKAQERLIAEQTIELQGLSDVDVSANGERPRVLVVEDDADMNRFISQCLAKEYEVISAFDGREGLAKALRFHPALVVSDIMMPNVSGVGMIAEMRKVDALATLPILLLSAKADDRLRIKLLEEGASDFIVKPFSEHDLLVRVRNLVRALQARAATEESLVQEQQEVELVRTIERIGSSITAEFDVHRIVQAVTDEATTLVGAQFGAFFYNVLNEQGESYTLYTLSGVPREAFSHFPMPRNTAVFAPTFHGTSVVRSGDITQDARYGHNAPHHGMPAGHLPVRSYLAVPVVSHNRQVLGGLFFGHERSDMFTDRHERLVVGIAGWAAVAMDNAQLYENQLRARAELEQALEAAQAARSEAERANLAKSQFLASMSHELRTPLNAIQGHVQLLEMGLHGPITEIQRETLERVQRSQRALQSLINDVLNFARLEAGRVEYFIQPVAVRETVTAVLQMAEPQLTAKSLTYSADIPSELRVAADPDKLRQILLNLLSNAIKFTEPGGRVTIDSAHREGVPREIVFVRVADTGCGIARPKQDEIFDPFVQVHRQHSVSAGIGLGLAISRDLARGMGGDLRVRSDEGGGSVFTLTLPRA